MSKQNGLVMVFALLVLLSITILGVSSVSSSLLQTKMASSMERKSVAFDAAEAGIAGVVYEAEDEVLLGNLDPANITTFDPLTEARQLGEVDLQANPILCADNVNRIRRDVTDQGFTRNNRHIDAGVGDFRAQGGVDSWSQTVFVREQACRGSSNVLGGSNINCHKFVIRGCGQAANASYTVANTVTASVVAPASN